MQITVIKVQNGAEKTASNLMPPGQNVLYHEH
ncbi:hypothetical protein MiTe_00874 [Microcystis aeruginosa NIES-2520]|uniref:Uncharacterized protein n=1 Tax=Microcystis aeruginosa NIES-2520 TaxID=2303982 RepID=A0A5A5RBX6_MICAE|nr:hypothetical protein MiTe_00874 [Microcystis aeruginosa NIES-2520]